MPSSLLFLCTPANLLPELNDLLMRFGQDPDEIKLYAATVSSNNNI